MRVFHLLLHWSWRDLRAHWAMVGAIALVIAIGTGGYAGLTSTSEWRRVSYDAAYTELAMYDLRIDLTAASTAPQGSLTDIVDTIPSADGIAATEERLILPVQVDASTAVEPVLVRGELVGSDFTDGGPHVNDYHPLTGRRLTETDTGELLAMVERNFAQFYGLPDRGTITLGGGREFEFVGQATSPEYFTVAPEGGIFMSEATFAAVFTSLETAQAVAGAPGVVNNLVLALTDGTDRTTVAAELDQALAAHSVGATVSTRDDNLSYKAMTTDIDQDQAMFTALAVLLFVGAVAAAFNLIHRLAEQQRREIGIGMAMGMPSRVIAVRPLLVSAEIALLGVVFGIGVGILIGNLMGAVFKAYAPLPAWDTSFQTAVFAQVAVIGLVVPFVASAVPVIRAVRVSPVDAIKPSHLTGGGLRMRTRLHRVRNTFRIMPFRNLRRAPRRTFLTVLAVAAAITVLVGFLGIMDSVFGAVDLAEEEAVGTTSDRISVSLDTFHPLGSPELDAIEGAESVAAIEPTTSIGATLVTAGEEIDAFVRAVDFDAGMWAPSLTEGTIGPDPGLVLAEKAAADLDLAVGDTVTLRHPYREGTSYTIVESQLPVVATHPHPARAYVYIDAGHVDVFNLAGVANGVDVLAGPGFTTDDVKREMFDYGWVGSVQSVTAVTEAIRDAFDQIIGIIQVMLAAVLVMVLLIAFNTAAINLSARAREHATMFAFGVRERTAVEMAVAESLVVGVAATILGIAGGFAMVWWMTQDLLARTLPDYALDVAVTSDTLIFVAGMGILAVAIAPLLTWRRMHRMELSGTLRLVE